MNVMHMHSGDLTGSCRNESEPKTATYLFSLLTCERNLDFYVRQQDIGGK